MSKTKQQITKQDAAEASHSGINILHEIRTLSEVADLVRYGDDSDDDIAQNQLFVLKNIIDEKLHEVFHALDFVDDYFLQAPKRRGKKNKLAVIKAA